jgi:putative ABC transport system permease protein
MDFSFAFSPWAAAEAALLAIVLVALFGGYGTWRILKAPPVPYLRTE